MPTLPTKCKNCGNMCSMASCMHSDYLTAKFEDTLATRNELGGRGKQDLRQKSRWEKQKDIQGFIA